MSGPLRTLVDGQDVDATWPLDRAFQYGDGLFETIRVRSGQLRFGDLHRARLADGCHRLAIAADLDHTWRQVARVATEAGDATLRLQVTRGVATARGYTPTSREIALSILCVYPSPSPNELPSIRKAVTLAVRLGENPALAGMKHCNRLEQVLGRLEMRDSDAFEGLMASSSGLMISGTMSNVFLELDGELVTPAVHRCGVAGVMRAAVLREAQRLGIAVRVAEVSLESAARCTALFLSNARMGLVPVHSLDDRRLGSSAALMQLAQEVAA